MKVWLILVLGLLGALMLTACGGGDDSAPATPTQVAGSDAGAGGARLVEVQILGRTFEPNAIDLQVGEPVQFRISGLGNLHTFTVPDLGIDQPFGNNKTVTTIVVTPQQGGTIGFHCKFHRQSGMVGTVNVS